MKKDEEIVKDVLEYLEGFEPKFRFQNIGKIAKNSDGIVSITGLSRARIGEVLNFPKDIKGMVVDLRKDEVGAIIFGDSSRLLEGDEVSSSFKLLSVAVSSSLLGRVIDPMIRALDDGGEINHGKDLREMPVEKIAPGIIYREAVTEPLQTGIKAIDAMIPIGRGQRELIIGDRNTGKTSLAIDTIINLSNENRKKGVKRVISIYVAIGQKQSKVAQVYSKLNEMNAMDETVIVCASASDPVALQYLAPYVGCAIAEFFMEKGEDVLIIYDDLTKHSWAYRQISLVLKRPSGREAYPGDIFYLHSRLLERSCKLSRNYGGGSITAFPIIETQAQDISTYIPTNVISITDGQIYLESDLFYQGIRPAINVGLSVSRVGGAAQLKAVKQVAGRLRLDLAQYNELAAFLSFGSDMDEVSKAKIERGKRIVELLKQPLYQPLSVPDQVLQLWYVTRGYLDEVDPSEALNKAIDFASFVLSKRPKTRMDIYSKDGITDSLEKELNKLASEFNS